jgi:uncharacterized phage protein (TIGR02218 family)
MTPWLDRDLTTLAFCWRLARRDGVTLGFTSHDRDLADAGLRYRATPGMAPSALERSTGFDADNVDLTGALTSDAIRGDDLAAGRWDGAQLTLLGIDWSQPQTDPLLLMSGVLGAVECAGDSFTVALHGPASALDAPVVEAISPDCRAALGDKRCRIDMAGRTVIVAVAEANEANITLAAPLAGSLFSRGKLRWVDGENAGLGATILQQMGATLSLSDRPYFPVTPGTRVEITQGCDRQLQTCKNRFNNVINFRGEPHLPGNDVLTRYVS